jgi:hypothetical protein
VKATSLIIYASVLAMLVVPLHSAKGQPAGTPRNHPKYKVIEIEATDGADSSRKSKTCLKMAAKLEPRTAILLAITQESKLDKEP